MIALPDTTRLEPLERHALAYLVDAAAVLPADGAAAAQAVRLVLDHAVPDEPDLPLRARADLLLPHGDGQVRLPVAWLRMVGDLLSMQSDGATAPKDRHGRPLSSANRLVQAGSERDPVVSALAAALRNTAARAAQLAARPYFGAQLWPHRKMWAACLSHDLDVASLWPAFTALRLAELAKKGDLARLGRVVASAGANLFGDPVRVGVQAVLDAERAAGARSTWFIICGSPTVATVRAGDVTYMPEHPRVRAILADLQAAGHEIGLHGSFETAADGANFVYQRTRLARLAAGAVPGVRQHFLKRTIGDTERAMASAGFMYDSTAGFPDRNGFRLGVADVVPVWDHATQQALALDELPFCWMDRAQSKYQGIEDPAVWIDDALELADRAARVLGVWCGIWHPNLTPALGFPGAHEAYARLVRELAARGAWLATADEIVRWRRARRSLRVVSVGPDGVPTVAGDPDAMRAAGAPLVVGDPQFRVSITVSG
jgi:hypothetical protein